MPKFTTLCASVDHRNTPGVWNNAPAPAKIAPINFHDTPVVLVPGEVDLVAGIGPAMTTVVQYVDNKAANPTWQTMPSLNTARVSTNAVLLPDASIFVVRGTGSTGPVYDCELYKNGHWYVINPDDAQYSPREGHSVAVLLPSGKVVIGGGE